MAQATVTAPTFIPVEEHSQGDWLSHARGNPQLAAGLLIVAAIMAFGLVGPFLINQEWTRTTAFAKDLKPGLDHILGTDSFGRDIMALIVVGTPQTVKVGLVAGGIALLVGTFLGFVQGYYSGGIGVFVRGFTDVMLTIPALLVLITLASQVRVVSVEGMALIIA